jgi:hypothetical protein
MTDQHASRQRTEQQHEYDDRSGFTHGLRRRLTSASWLARAASVGSSSIAIGFVVLFASVLETGGDVALFTRPLPMRTALALPYLIAVSTVGTTAGALLAWRYRHWSLPVRIHQTVLALLGLAFCWQLSRLGFLAV